MPIPCLGWERNDPGCDSGVLVSMSLIPPHVELPDDQKMLIEAAREFAEGELLPLDRRWDTSDGSVSDILPQLGEMGLLNLCIPESLGGVGCPYRVYAAILHEIATCSPSTAVTISVHSMVGGVINKCATEPLRSEWLSNWGNPAHFAAFALSEAGAGSDVASTKTTATKVDGGYRLNGEKMWITNGMRARWFLMLARVAQAEDGKTFCAVLLDGNQKGVERTEIKGKMGIRGSETAVIHLSDAFVPDSHVIGALDKGIHVCLSSLNEGRIAIAAQATGISQACLTEMIRYARQREQFGRTIGEFQAVAQMLADSATELEAAKGLVWHAACKVDQGHPDRVASSMAKLYASESANRIAYRAVQVHGGSGYVNEFRVEQLYRDARVTTIYEGTSEIQRMVIARGLIVPAGMALVAVRGLRASISPSIRRFAAMPNVRMPTIATRTQASPAQSGQPLAEINAVRTANGSANTEC